MNKKPITKEELLKAGWKETGDPVFPYEKDLCDEEDPDYDQENTIKLVVHGLYNIYAFALSLPDGGLVNIVADSIKDLNQFEKMIASYDPPY